MAEEYDVVKAIQEIEDELIASMMRNLKRHRAEEDKLGINWEQWQVKQLAALEEYKKRNLKKYKDVFGDIDSRIDSIIRFQRAAGNTEQEVSILQAIKEGAKLKKVPTELSAGFFRMNDRKMDALIKATTNDLGKAEYAMLRMSNDKYRQVIFNAQMYANSGAGTYEKAVDMATKDFLKAGINCVEYKNGARHTVSDYADMAIRTASKRAYLTGEGEKRKEWGISTVIMNKRGNPCPKCLPFVGKVLIDDVWSGGSSRDGSYPLMSSAIAAGLYHPRCKDSHTTYFPDISEPPEDKFTRRELEDIDEQGRREAKQQYAARQAESLDRLARYSLDDENSKMYAARREEWKRKCTYSVIDKDVLKQDINSIRVEKSLAQNKFDALAIEEKALTKRVYFGETGTQEDADRLKKIVEYKKSIKEQIDALDGKILEKQHTYKTAAENRILESGILEEIRLSPKMVPEAVDELENTLFHLKEKYGIMPKGVVYNPAKVPDATASYNWIDDKIYLSNRFNDPDKYLETIKKSEDSLKKYQKHYDIMEKAKEEIKNMDAILAVKSIKGYEREKAVLAKANAEIRINTLRQAVRENMSDVLIHEYGHFINRHAQMDYIQKKNVFGMRDLGGKLINGDWVFDMYTDYSRIGKITASKISKYATDNPYEAFAEGFLAMEKGERIPEEIAKVINEAMEKAGAKITQSSVESAIEKGYEVVNDRIIKVLNNNHTIKEVLSFKYNGIIHNVDGVHAVLDYSDAELKMAESLVKIFKTDISMVPRVMIPQRISTADFIIDNKVFDLKSPTGSSKNLLYNILHKKKRQSNNFIIDISQVRLSETEIMEQAKAIYKSEHTSFVDELILVKNGKIVHHYKK